MQWFQWIVISGLLLICSDAASVNRPETSEKKPPQTQNSISSWNNLMSLVSYFATSTPSSDYSEDYYEDDCKPNKTAAPPPETETIIIYDVDEQQVSPKNGSSSPRAKRSANGTTEVSEARHKEVRPYPGYFLGRKLWYVPLWFSIYYSFYLLCLVVKSVARHRISYPALLPADATLERKRSRNKSRKQNSAAARRITDSINMYSDRYRPYQ